MDFFKKSSHFKWYIIMQSVEMLCSFTSCSSLQSPHLLSACALEVSVTGGVRLLKSGTGEKAELPEDCS